MAYNSLVHPQLEYASAVWSPYTKNIGKIEKIQRKAARWVLNDYSTYSSVTDTLSNLGLRSLENRRTDACLTMFYKIVFVFFLYAFFIITYCTNKYVTYFFWKNNVIYK